MLKVGVNLPAFGVDESAGVREHARHAERLGLESVWVGDHLLPVRPYLDSTIVLATAAAVTERVKIGFGVMILALRPVAWAAKQIASLQHLSGDRVLLGVGSGGSVHGDAAWRAVGIPYAERARRTDAALEILPSLVEGKPTDVNGEVIALSPGATMPPVLIGAGPIRRAARFADEWYPAFSAPAEIAEQTGRLAGLAAEYGRPVPRVTIGLSVGLGDLPASVIDAQARSLMEYGMSEEEARRGLITGPPAAAAERFAELAEVGVHRVIGMPFPADRLRQSELLAETNRLLNP
ncbi:Flavin-dependent oxidoreductase, luciferase family (includes alkanesulfonate monooxygenase SsuD and methylene tetrahydromethanopterin reductase) [Nonomuraea solani]|uniref:Flavin-dependent oxidoreductase, luciferase family (Includes alkanesulfonate monooxygenase SsuD and methylene tetrahydromethanopterin reductase) n=1 Tax=Nonomuraea solani TaxID=1144553 RepID=A0A1H6E3E4_9ACTN|nr:LLM class flavin-dependent oxidoreductase [Nonomuraea solani]SEG92208.1 Flavin-dependent oxidoreductase, luciferase family (includes alkanesulfonate monooxygenase SsuD and methylene tetrahydromethanopterin reductase) [Nonomuraea solani]